MESEDDDTCASNTSSALCLSLSLYEKYVIRGDENDIENAREDFQNFEPSCNDTLRKNDPARPIPAMKALIEDKDTDKKLETVADSCHVKLDSIIKLKDSTKKLLCLIEEIQGKTHGKNVPDKLANITEIINTTDYNDDEDVDCSIYNRLTRKCHCLNRQEYNDFVIHFNENTKYTTTAIGEIIKNLKILKKFLYMGGVYTKNALHFLNEAFINSSHSEKVEIAQACSHTDICNIFEPYSIVISCISWPFKYEFYGDASTQILTATFLLKLCHIEEGRRYLNFTSKISSDIRRILRKKASKMHFETFATLNSILNHMMPPVTAYINAANLGKALTKGIGFKTIQSLIKCRRYMTLDEVMLQLDLLYTLCSQPTWKNEISQYLPNVLCLFKNMLMEYNSSEMNIMITNILNNIVSKSMVTDEPEDPVQKLVNTATEPIYLDTNQNTIQKLQKKLTKKVNKPKTGTGIKQVAEWEPRNKHYNAVRFGKGVH